MTEDVSHYLRFIGKKRSTRLEKSKSASAKKHRQAKYQLKLLAKTVVAKRERAKREGTYCRGMGINGGYTEEELAKAKVMFPSDYKVSAAAAKKASTTCKFCFKIGHSTNRSRECQHHGEWLASRGKQTTDPTKLKKAPATPATNDDASVVVIEDTPEDQAMRDAQECDLLDQVPLDGDDDDDADAVLVDCLGLEQVLSDLGKDEEPSDEFNQFGYSI